MQSLLICQVSALKCCENQVLACKALHCRTSSLESVDVLVFYADNTYVLVLTTSGGSWWISKCFSFRFCHSQARLLTAGSQPTCPQTKTCCRCCLTYRQMQCLDDLRHERKILLQPSITLLPPEWLQRERKTNDRCPLSQSIGEHACMHVCTQDGRHAETDDDSVEIVPRVYETHIQNLNVTHVKSVLTWDSRQPTHDMLSASPLRPASPAAFVCILPRIWALRTNGRKITR